MNLIQLFLQTTTEYKILYLAVVCILIIPNAGLPLDDVYHNLDEIHAELLALQDEFPDWVTIDSVAHSSRYELPIWMAKLSDNPEQEENEPSILYIGQVHAEEVIGVEFTLHFMRFLLENIEDDEFSERLENSELYFIPTANPEGLRVVHSGADDTFRKNCKDNVGDGVLRIQDEPGLDTSGVDLNRNFGLHWDRGDSIYFVGDGLPYNYYRGPAPFSEPEAQMLRDLALRKKFLYSLTYHSSRSGQNSELIIAPWNWDGKVAPDYRAIDALMDTLANQIPIQAADDIFYIPVHTLQRLGQTIEWFYQATGTYQYIIEIGEDIQPDSALLVDLIEDQINAATYLIDLAIGAQTLDGFGHLVINTVDAISGEPISAKLINDQIQSPVLEPRRTTEEVGRFDWLLPSGDYNFTVSANEYAVQQIDDIQISNGEIIELLVELEPLPLHEVNIEILDASNDQALEASMSMLADSELIGSWIVPQDGMSLVLPARTYDVEIVKDGYLPMITELEFVLDSNNVTLYLLPAEITYDETFEEMDNWQHGGIGDEWGIIEFDHRSILTESTDGAYQNEAAPWLLIQTGAAIEEHFQSIIRLIHRPYFEPSADSGKVNLWNRADNSWVTCASFSQFPSNWDTTYINCGGLPDGNISIRFQITTDDAVTEDGWSIDRLTIYRSTVWQEVDAKPVLPDRFSMSLFPNPTNGYTSLHLKLINTGVYSYEIYDAVGRKVARKMVGTLMAGEHNFSIDTGLFTSGVYFLNIGSRDQSQLVKLTLLK